MPIDTVLSATILVEIKIKSYTKNPVSQRSNGISESPVGQDSTY